MKKLAILLFFCMMPSADASLLTNVQIGDEFLEVQYFAGTGPSTAYVIIDFAAAGGDTYAFGYRFNSVTATGHDALLAIESAGALDYSFTEFDFGGGPVPFTDNFSYLAEIGNPNEFWSYTVGSYSPIDFSVTWSDAAAGAGERILVDGGFDGWYNDFGPSPEFESIPPAIPTLPANVAVPEPSTITLATISILIFCSLCWRRKHRNR